MSRHRRMWLISLAIPIIAASCGSGDNEAESGSAAPATSEPADAMTTQARPAPATTPVPPSTPVPSTTVPATIAAASVPSTSPATAPATAPPTTSTEGPSSALDELVASGYTISDEWVVETVVSDFDSGTGGLAVDADGFIYQADFGYVTHPGNRVYRIAPDGAAETLAESDDFASLTATVFGPDDTLYQSSYGTGKVFRIDSTGEPTVVAEDLRGPTGLVIRDDGTIFVQTYDSGTVHQVDPDGTVSEFARDPAFAGPNGLTSGPDGTLYAVNHRNGTMFEIATDGTVTELHRFPGRTAHVAYLDGSLYITGRSTFVIFRYDIETGAIEIIAGNGEPNESDGRGTAASFGRPNAITVAPDGALYFNHADNEDDRPVTIKRIVRQP